MVENAPPDTFRAYSEMFRVAAASQDVADYHDAMAGREVGRIGKNFSRQDVDPQTGEKGKDASSRLQRTLDWLLLNDSSYAAAHKSALFALTNAESTVTEGLAGIIQTLADERRALEGLEDRAARLLDGTLVFRNSNGDVLTADGHPVSDEDTAGIEWRGDEPTYEEYRAQRDRIEGLEQAERELRGIETELGDIRGELTDQQEPPTEDRVGELQDRIGELQDRISDVQRGVRQAVEAPELEADSLEVGSTDIERISTASVPAVGSLIRP